VFLDSIVSESISRTPRTVQVPWSILTGGSPAPRLDPTQLLGIQLQFDCGETQCQPKITLAALNFYK
jgi:hypothetical protein